MQQDACRDNSEDPSDVETEAFPRVGRPAQGTACCCLGVFVVKMLAVEGAIESCPG